MQAGQQPNHSVLPYRTYLTMIKSSHSALAVIAVTSGVSNYIIEKKNNARLYLPPPLICNSDLVYTAAACTKLYDLCANSSPTRPLEYGIE